MKQEEPRAKRGGRKAVLYIINIKERKIFGLPVDDVGWAKGSIKSKEKHKEEKESTRETN